jgi:hypothetical protein
MRNLDWARPPEDRLGAVVPLDLEPLAGEGLAMALTHLTVYPCGFEFAFTAVTAVEPGELCAATLEVARERGEDPVGLSLHFGVEFADGRREDAHAAWISINGPSRVPPGFPRQMPPDPETEIFIRGGGSSPLPHRYPGSAYVWPLPPPGPLTFWLGWPAAGMPVTPLRIDAAAVLDVAGTDAALWEEP